MNGDFIIFWYRVKISKINKNIDKKIFIVLFQSIENISFEINLTIYIIRIIIPPI